ncbi:SusC/RagA family TonB-linked outer membrane protein [Pedobacter sp. MC2016-14]|uniref:SusC/RagA family TonB-linked outer membrane protein n=1 Tax=Pedobacter sp. MC2016-14 TaxID=2897327 RepID=UPI001E47B0E5|nr:SusC/RagA family TonB-linked outer membrane protein [Pedobacter sp. MC2016-14]MCD0489805.1 SusC/RagA family TonB-linked outer membrane protein [Pedobacter sp. MC2016-14]
MYKLFTGKVHGLTGFVKKLLLVMRLIVLLLTTAILQVSASGFAQKVTIREEHASLEGVLAKIKMQTGYDFIYDEALIVSARPVTVKMTDVTLDKVLKACFEGQAFTYSILDKTIIVKDKPSSIFDKIRASMASISVEGVVLDDQNQAMPGVTVKEKGTGKGIITTANGAFKFNVTDENSILVFSFVGYQIKEILAKMLLANHTVILLRSDMNLTEVVINKGYYNTTKALNTGNVSTVSAKSIEQQPVSNPLAAMQGQVAGMFITQSSGVPGGDFKVQIRGQNSIANGNDPLYVIDGVPYSIAPQLQSDNNLNPTGGNPLNFINPHDIESIDVLKDADATAIYGSRGANGVVLITTKKGKAGETRVDFNVYQGIGKITRAVQYLNTVQYLQMRNEAFKNDGVQPDPAIDLDILGGNTWDPNSYTDWQKLLIGGTAHYSDAQGSISGGNELTQYTVGGGYHRETTVFPGTSSDQKGSLHFSVNSSSKNQRFKMVFTGNYIADFTTLPKVDPTSYLTTLAPNAPEAYLPDGALNWAGGSWRSGNPYAYLQQPYYGRTTNLLSNLILSYAIVKGLEIKTSLGYTNLQADQKVTIPLTSLDPLTGAVSGNSTFNHANTRSWIAEPQLNYKLTYGNHQFSALVGTSFQQSHNDGVKLLANGFSSDLLLGNLQAASKITPQSVTDIFYKYNAIYSRINYSFKEKYVVNLTARRDGSSRFGPGKQFANFGAAGAAWIFSKENWVAEHLKFLSFGKLRASYGSSGNDQVSDYTFLDRYNSTTNTYGGAQGLFPVSFFNPLLAWEQNTKMETALELGFLDNKLNFSASYYRNRSSNQLLDLTLSAVTGFAFISENLPATVQNNGLEFTLSTVNIQRDNFKWNTSFNLSIPRNKLVAFPDIANTAYNSVYIIGQPLTISRIYKYEGVDTQTGLYQFMGADGQLTSDPIMLTDEISVVDRAPKYYGGLQNSLSYKHFTLDFLFHFVKQKGANFEYVNVDGIPGSYAANQPVGVLTRWQNPGDISNIQRFNQDYSTITSSNAAAMSDQQFKDASFIRLKNLSLSYTLPNSWFDVLKVRNARFYFQGQNLLTITKYIGYDPENRDYTSLPPLKVYTMGLQITL